MTDDRILDIFQAYGQYATGKDYAMIHAIAEAVSPQRTWVHATEWRGLTDEEISAIAFNSGDEESAIHAAMDLLKEKNQ